MNFTHSYHADAATSAKSECKISDFQPTDKRKSQKTRTFFVILMKNRTFALDFDAICKL